jgi:hypothetical protein
MKGRIFLLEFVSAPFLCAAAAAQDNRRRWSRRLRIDVLEDRLAPALGFAPALDFSVGSNPTSVTVGDFDGDGYADLAVANLDSDTISVLLGDGEGGFAAAPDVAVSVPLAVAVGDFNGDGNADLAAASVFRNAVGVLLGDGAGGFAAPANSYVDSGSESLTVGDFNGDGNADLAVANSVSNNVSILLGDGAGDFAAAISFGVGDGHFVTTGDFNGDGNADLVNADFDQDTVSVLLGDGAGSFAAARTFFVESEPRGVATGDFNGDGHADLATASGGSNNASVLLGDGTGGFGMAIGVPIGSSWAVTVGDFDGDGNADLAAVTTDGVRVRLGNGAGGFTTGGIFGVGASPFSVATADFNGDDLADLATANLSSNTVSVLINEPDAEPPTIVVTTNLDVVDASDGLISLREAIAAARSGSVIAFGDGSAIAGGTDYTDAAPETITLNGPLSLTKSITITGLGANLLSISGAQLSRVFHIGYVTPSELDVSISGLTVTGGGNVSDGGGIWNSGNLTLANVVLSRNSAGWRGGGIYNSGRATITNSTLSGNSAMHGGGIYNIGTATITNSTLSGNSVSGSMFSSGGGIYNNGTATITNSTLSGNSASPLDVFDRPGPGFGGGIHNTYAEFDLGGLLGTVTLNNSLVAGNFNGTGSPSHDVGGPIASNSSNNLIGDAASAGGLVNGVNGNIIGVDGIGVRPIASILDTTLNNNGGPTATHALANNSLARSAGSTAVPGYVPFDQHGAARDGNPDIGAYEVNHPSPAAVAAYLHSLYRSVLLRDPDPVGLAYWAGKMNLEEPLGQIAYGFINSLENRANQVTSYYRDFLHREPDAGGLAFHIARLQSGVGEAAVIADVVLSPEFASKNDNAALVNLIYAVMLGRSPEAFGFSHWMSQLQAGGNARAHVVHGILRSHESYARVVSGFFVSYLKRSPDAASLNDFVAALHRGITFGSVASHVLASPEYFGLVIADL